MAVATPAASTPPAAATPPRWADLVGEDEDDNGGGDLATCVGGTVVDTVPSPPPPCENGGSRKKKSRAQRKREQLNQLEPAEHECNCSPEPACNCIRFGELGVFGKANDALRSALVAGCWRRVIRLAAFCDRRDAHKTFRAIPRSAIRQLFTEFEFDEDATKTEIARRIEWRIDVAMRWSQLMTSASSRTYMSTYLTEQEEIAHVPLIQTRERIVQNPVEITEVSEGDHRDPRGSEGDRQEHPRHRDPRDSDGHDGECIMHKSCTEANILTA